MATPKRGASPRPYFGDSAAPLFSIESMLILGDNLETLPIWVRDESVDLIYLDPPFNSNANYNMLFKHVNGAPAAAQMQAFTDTWGWNDAAATAYDDVVRAGGDTARVMHSFWEMLDGPCNMLAYLSMMAPRLVELRRVLKADGSLWLHCDPTASHYLKLLLDAVFGAAQFRNEVIWHYFNKMQGNIKRLASDHDIILWYSKGQTFTFHPVLEEREGGPKKMLKRRWDKDAKRLVNAKDEDGHVQYIERTHRMADDVWRMPMLQPASREKLGYPTQKPLALLERIIAATSNPGDVVLDPFCGCGTTVDAAERLGRKWVGIDISREATKVIAGRLKAQHPGCTWTRRILPTTIEEAHGLAEDDRHAFQEWACRRIGATPTGKGADRGIDGQIDDYLGGNRWRGLVSVKSGRTVSVSELRDLLGTVQRERAQTGIFVTLVKPPKTFARDVTEAGIGDLRIPRLQVITIEELFAGKQPVVPAPHGVAQFDASEKPDKPRGRPESALAMPSAQ